VPRPPAEVRRARARACLAGAVVALGLSLPVTAVAQGKLLEPERAFAFSARGLDDRTVEARFAIAEGYYLYRDRLKFSVEPVALAGAPDLPAGKVKEDPFFGRVATYRGQIIVRLPLDRIAAGATVIVTAESQGCADAGVCYPPQVQKITLALPAANAPPGGLVDAAPSRRIWFK
jgi:thioredoxin:protein disulfide reductase